jgi:ribose transport system permease protein
MPESLPEKKIQKKNKWISIYVIELLVLLALFGIGSLTLDGFFSPATLISLLVLSSFLGIAAGGQTFVVVLGAIDLSIPAMIGVSNVLVGQLNGAHYPFPLICLIILLVAIALGTINGWVSKTFKINSMITTLATGAIAAGGLLVWAKGTVGSPSPDWLMRTVAMNGRMGFIPLPPVVAVWALYSLIVLVLLYKTAWGKRLYATGANENASEFAGTNTTLVWIVAFILSAVSAAIGGILLAGFSGSALFNVGEPYLFMTIGAVVVGGTSLIGGRGGYGRTIFGALLLTLMTTLMIGYGLNTALQQVFTGLLIVLMLGAYGKQQPIHLRM